MIWKKTKIRLGLYTLFFLSVGALPATAQLTLTPLPKQVQQAKAPSSREQTQTPVTLPFWDDFSFTSASTPLDSLWEFGKSVWVNNGMGIQPPSIGVATFDGLDSLGRPYSVNDVLEKGFADHLISQPIQLNLVPAAERASVFISFFFQIRGNGEAPDTGDILRLQFMNQHGVWETVWSVENDNTRSTEQFYPVILAVPTDNDRFFSDKFRIRFQNFARRSGPFDTWNVDYIYINRGRTNTDVSFPDRTLVSPLSSIFGEYYSIPLEHFREDPAALLKPASFTMYNLREGNIQPVNYYTTAVVTNIVDGAANELPPFNLDNEASVGAINPLSFKTSQILTLPPLSAFDANADTITIDFRLGLSTKDNQLITADGDYDPAKYAPVQFRWNDTTRTHYFLSNFYAYDDGSAEYGAGLNQPGSKLMYEFNMLTDQPDTLIEVQIYFPRFGDETQQLLQLQILKDLSDSPSSILHQQSITVQRSQQDDFGLPYKLTRFVGVQGKFYIGWQQNASAAIPVGLDKNTDSGNRIFTNTNGVWEQNQTVRGSLMIRPTFGKGGVVVGVDDEEPIVQQSYPNPNQGLFSISAEARNTSVYTLTGAKIFFEEERQQDRINIRLQNATPGIYLLRYEINGRYHTEKIIVRQ